MCGAGFPPCWFLAWGNPTLEPIWLFGGASDGLWEWSRQGVLPITSAASVLVLTMSHSHPASAGNTPTLAGRFDSVSYGVLLLPLHPSAHTTLCVSSKSGVFLPPSPFEVLQSNPASLQSLTLQEFLLPLPYPEVGKPDGGLRTFTPVGGLLWYKCSPVF